MICRIAGIGTSLPCGNDARRLADHPSKWSVHIQHKTPVVRNDVAPLGSPYRISNDVVTHLRCRPCSCGVAVANRTVVRGRGKQRTTAGYVQVRTLTDHDLIDYRQVEVTQLIDLVD